MPGLHEAHFMTVVQVALVLNRNTSRLSPNKDALLLLLLREQVTQGFKMLSHWPSRRHDHHFNALFDFKQHDLFQTCMNNWIEQFNEQQCSYTKTVCYNYSLPLNERNVSIFEGKYFLNLTCLSFVLQRQIKEVSPILSKFPSRSNVMWVDM